MNKFQKASLMSAAFTMTAVATTMPMNQTVQAETEQTASQQIENAEVTLSANFQPNFEHVQALMLFAINQLRAENGLQPLQYSQQITNAWAQEICDRSRQNGTVTHQMSDQRTAMQGIGLRFYGENLAMTPLHVPINAGGEQRPAITSDAQLAIALVSQYYDDIGVADFGHRKNLLNPYYDQVGIAFSSRVQDGVLEVYNSLDFAGTPTQATNQAIDEYLAYTSNLGLDHSKYPHGYTPLNAVNIDYLAQLVAVTHGDSPLFHGCDQHKTGLDRQLPAGSHWRITAARHDENGHLWYQVGTNQWIDSNQVSIHSLA